MKNYWSNKVCEKKINNVIRQWRRDERDQQQW